jgi:hypothetical protein
MVGGMNVDQDDGLPSRVDGLWTADDVAGYLKLSRRWVLNEAAAGRMPHRRIPGCSVKGVRFVPDEIRAFALGPSAAVPMRKSA